MPLLRDGQRGQQKKNRKQKKEKTQEKGKLYHNGEPKPTEISARLRDINENITDIHTNSFFYIMITFCPSQGMAKEKRHRRMVKK